MKEAMDVAFKDSSTERMKPTFSVQSERDIWWLGAFEVPKESYEVLAFVFERIPWISNIIRNQISGQKLDVEGLGSFYIDWHLGGDLKTIKCMLGCTQGATTPFPCPWCMGKVSSKNRNSHHSDTLGNEAWVGGVLQSPTLAPPNRHLLDAGWSPILPFPLANVHFCTLHAFMRIFDRLLKCHIDYAFTMPGKARQDEALSKVENLLNEIGCHGGNVQIRVDKKISGVNHEVAQKVSISGAKARGFLKRPPSKAPKFLASNTSTKRWELWKDLCSFTTSGGSDPNLALLREKVWVDFNAVVRLMSLQITTPNERQQFTEAIRNFTTSFVNAWGEVNITHYIVSN